jgi:hypothetical protein
MVYLADEISLFGTAPEKGSGQSIFEIRILARQPISADNCACTILRGGGPPGKKYILQNEPRKSL